MISELELMNKDPKDFQIFRVVLQYLRRLPFSSYDLEYVIENGEVIFTDLTIEDNIYTKHDTEISEAKDEI